MKIKIFLFALAGMLAISLTTKAQFSLATGTQITLADNTKKNIENIVSGDKVLAFNIKDKVYEEVKVKSTSKVMLNRLVRVRLETGVQLIMTVDQPIYAEKGWASIDPSQTMDNQKFAKIQRCNIGDFVMFYNVTSTDYVEVSVIQGILEPTQTYILELEKDNAIVANGFLVGQN